MNIRRARQNRKRSMLGQSRGETKKHVVRSLAFLTILAAAGGGCWYGWQGSAPDAITWADRLFAIKVVKVTEGRRVSHSEVLALLDLAPGQGLLVADPEPLERVLETHPWIRRADVRRVFPHTLAVELNERDPVAILQTGGPDFLLDQDGVIITEEIPGKHKGLPVLTGVGYVEAVLGNASLLQRLRAGIALAGLLDRAGARQMEVDLRTPGDMVAYYSGQRLRFGDGAFEEKVDRYRRVSDRMFDPRGGRKSPVADRGVEVDLRFRDRIILRDRG